LVIVESLNVVLNVDIFSVTLVVVVNFADVYLKMLVVVLCLAVVKEYTGVIFTCLHDRLSPKTERDKYNNFFYSNELPEFTKSGKVNIEKSKNQNRYFNILIVATYSIFAGN